MTERRAQALDTSRRCAPAYPGSSHPVRWIRSCAQADCGSSGCCSGPGHAGSVVPASLPKWLLCYLNFSHQSIPRWCEHGSLGAGGPACRAIRQRLICSPSIAARMSATIGPNSVPRPACGLRLQPRRSGHRCFLGRTVVLTIGRLVASNPSFASVRAPAHRYPTNR